MIPPYNTPSFVKWFTAEGKKDKEDKKEESVLDKAIREAIPSKNSWPNIPFGD